MKNIRFLIRKFVKTNRVQSYAALLIPLPRPPPALMHICYLKSVNLQYNTLVCWAYGTNDLSTKCLMFQVLYLQNSLQKPFQFILFFHKITKMKIKRFECPKSIKNYEKKYLECQTLGRQVVCPISPANQRIIL